ncbi:O-linked N-acetylglucosamine transferase, SPINDLY family protein [Microcoleus sp. herbarium12]|uniref:O-linked N-acetylglucosamine transferase, SPINDLY family protein n=1 Tax=Microcoleus sp. herbarium12 TaxID=3055437 RepID=UPI002FD639BB
MIDNSISTLSVDWQQQAHKYLLQKNYGQAGNLYEQAIEAEPEIKSYYWYLGLMLLLQGQELEAQTTWLLGMADGELEEVEIETVELIQVLQTEAERQANLEDYSVAWAIRQHIREINPTDINNLLHLIGLSILLENYTGDQLNSLGVIEILKSEPPIEVDFLLLMEVLKSVLDRAPLHPSSLELAEACVAYAYEPHIFLQTVFQAALEIGAVLPQLAARFVEACARLDPEKLDILQRLAIMHHLATVYQSSRQYDKGIEVAKLCYSLAEELPDKVYGNHKILRGLLGATGYWEEVGEVIERHQAQLGLLVAQQSLSLDSVRTQNLFCTTFFFPYIQDRAETNRQIHNQVAQLCQANIQVYAKDRAERFRKGHLARKSSSESGKRLKIGYVSHCLGRHSVGWLARWLIQYHDRDRFQINGYFMAYVKGLDPLKEWYLELFDQSHKGGISGVEMAEKIYQDEVDILIDLDSLTLDVSCEVLGLKPAPIQVTWLGWDACGLPAVDYFIADPYVLPESAQDYYSEKIWRLPQTYIGVDGFEADTPTWRREDLNIPGDAVVYLSSQTGYKRHPHTARLQLKIIAQVPNSYFLIKGGADEEAVKRFFIELGEEEGVDCSRLRFLPQDPLESTHRANLGIADVVLDTYPYNGATTTLETLWMCIPLVTRVGEQFAARNSYTMMMNVGVEEGIAWTDEEYVEWGVRFGKDPTLRHVVSGRLRQSRQTSPLWNGKQFAREIEKAYEQMWQRYVEGQH